MNSFTKVALALICAAASLQCTPKDAGWPEITRENKPGVRWWWLGSAVDAQGLKTNLDEISKAGFGTVEVTPLYGVNGYEDRELPFLSDRWMEALGTTEAIAAKDDIQVDLLCGTGWPFGGPNVDVEESACKAVFQEWDLRGGVNKLDLRPAEKIRSYTHFSKLMAYGPGGAVLDFTEDVRKDGAEPGEVVIGLPAGKWHVIAFYISRTMQKVKRAAPGGEGLVIDHLDPKALRHYLDWFDNAFAANPQVKWPSTVFDDSYEVYGADWTPAFLDEFRKRRGYPLEEHFPELLGEVDDGKKTIADYRQTMNDLLLENFTYPWVEWAHSHGMKVRYQAHGSPANLLDAYGAVDIPEIEGFGMSNLNIKGLRKDDPYFTRRNASDLSMFKYASSAAHVTGKNITSSETCTWLTEHFRTSLSQIKPELDLMFSAGVNRVMFHGNAYSPSDDPWPGWKFYASIDMSSTNSIWRDVPAMTDYISRCQSFLQRGRPDADFLVLLPVQAIWHRDPPAGDRAKEGNFLMRMEIHYLGAVAPDFAQDILQIDSLGYDCDYISDTQLLDTHVENGLIVTSGGASYKGIIVPDPAYMPEASKAKLAEIEAAGIKVGSYESAAPEEIRSKLHMRMIRRRDADGYIYFIANQTPDDVDADVSLAVPFASAMLFNPMDGSTAPALVRGGKVNVALRSGESIILRTWDSEQGFPEGKSKPEATEFKTIDGPWTLTFTQSAPEVKGTYNLGSTRTWEGLDEKTAVTMGTGSYACTFELSSADIEGADGFMLDLGDVRESARVWLNGKYLGCIWAVPFTVDCSKAVKAGKNDLRIEVTNLPANRIADMDRRGVPWRKMKDANILNVRYKPDTYAGWDPVPSGLNSDVRLMRHRQR
ncbi:MAG: glycosyl hydrolase family 2 [Bacteroidales bacterium]|nr:glycosyl hydrolase family 2 [Bacteroidales bacterium]